jgi:hypothetical protein
MDNFVYVGQERLNKYIEYNVFPLFTKQGLADRWKTTRQNVNNWEGRHMDFCKPIDGFVNGGGKYYPLFEVERYEKARGLGNAREHI